MAKTTIIEKNENIINALTAEYKNGNAKPISKLLEKDDANMWENTVESVYRAYEEYARIKYEATHLDGQNAFNFSVFDFAMSDKELKPLREAEKKLTNAAATLLNRIGMRYDPAFISTLGGLLEMWRKGYGDEDEDEKTVYAPFIRCRGSVLKAFERACGFMLQPTGIMDNFRVWQTSQMSAAQRHFRIATEGLEAAQKAYDISANAYNESYAALSEVDIDQVQDLLKKLKNSMDKAKEDAEKAGNKKQEAEKKLNELKDRTPEEWGKAYRMLDL